MFSQGSSTPLRRASLLTPCNVFLGLVSIANGALNFPPRGSELFCENIQQSSFSMFSHLGEKEHAVKQGSKNNHHFGLQKA